MLMMIIERNMSTNKHQESSCYKIVEEEHNNKRFFSHELLRIRKNIKIKSFFLFFFLNLKQRENADDGKVLLTLNIMCMEHE